MAYCTPLSTNLATLAFEGQGGGTRNIALRPLNMTFPRTADGWANDLPQNGGRLGVVPTGSIRTWGERLVGNNSCTTVTVFLVRLVARVAGPRPDEAPRILQRRETGSNDP